MVNYAPSEPLSLPFVADVNAVIADFVDTRSAAFAAEVPAAKLAIQVLSEFATGGKRFRPGFCFWGYVAAAGFPEDPYPLLRAAASLDLLHVGILLHDDVVDDSATRRGMPTVHAQYAGLHDDLGYLGDPEAFGRGGAIVLGDVLQMWSVELWQESGIAPEASRRALPYLSAMRTEVNVGQLYDLAAQVQDPLAIGAEQVLVEAYRVVEHKTSRYTAQRPTQIGAALAGGSEELLAALGQFGLHIGRAFQFRDDVLGVFGDPNITGKDSCDDLEEGKLTALIGLALKRSNPETGRELCDLLGRSLTPNDIDRCRKIITDSGALAALEGIIQDEHQAALTALDTVELVPDGRLALTALANLATNREY